MANDLKLKGNELLAYAIIYGFSQDGRSWFTGSLQYLADWTNCTKRGIIKVLQSLVKRGLVKKREVRRNGQKYCEYMAGGEQSSPGNGTKFTTPSEQSSPNTINDTIDDTIEGQTCARAQPTPKEVYERYIEQGLDVPPERFWNYNNNRRWRDKRGRKIKDWKSAYDRMRPNPDETHDPALKFVPSDYGYYTGG